MFLNNIFVRLIVLVYSKKLENIDFFFTVIIYLAVSVVFEMHL